MDWFTLGQLLSTAGGAIGAGSGTELGAAAAGLGKTMNDFARAKRFEDLLAQMGQSPGGVNASQTAAQSSAPQAPAQQMPQMQPQQQATMQQQPQQFQQVSSVAKIDPMHESVREYTRNPISGEETFNFFKPADWAQAVGGNPAGSGTTQVPFQEALKKLRDIR